VIKLACLSFLLTAAAVAVGTDAVPQARLAETDHDFGEVRLGQTVSHDFPVKNLGKGVLKVERAELSLPNMALRAEAIEPGADGRIGLELKTAGMAGLIEAQALIYFNDPQLPKAVLTLRGRVRPPIEFLPFGAVYLAAFRGEPVERIVTVVNHEEKPNAVKHVQSEGGHFLASLKTVDPGKVYAVTVKVVPGTPVGRYEETLAVEMTSPAGRVLKVPVHLFVKPDLYASQDAVDFGEFSLDQVRRSAGIQEMLNQTLIVTSRRDQFSILSIVCDQPAVTVRQTPASGPSKTFRLDVSLNLDRLERGPFSGTIVVKTGDAELPELKIPIRGDVR
jgi:Protein of unknown function (DUF1573)